MCSGIAFTCEVDEMGKLTQRGEIQNGAQVTVLTQLTKFIFPHSYIKALN